MSEAGWTGFKEIYRIGRKGGNCDLDQDFSDFWDLAGLGTLI